jgi:hypothetical protein
MFMFAAHKPRLVFLVFVSLFGFVQAVGGAESQVPPRYAELPANRWVLLHREDDSGGKAFAQAVFADSIDRIFLWGTGGEKPVRNVYKRYELEAFDPDKPAWSPAFPSSKQDQWTAAEFPPFRIYGQGGPDGLKFDEGPRLQVVGGYHSTNRIRWWDFDGVRRPSPVLTFNMACRDSKRNRLLFYSDGVTFALDPRTNSWTDLKAKNYPATCKALAWASMCYDPGADRVLLVGGGLATNPSGAAPTWYYDCEKNVWERPQLDSEPPPRCNAPIVYDPATQSMILFGGYNQAAALNDTWVFDCRGNRWEQRQPSPSPPPMDAPAVAVLPESGRILVCGNDARRVRLDHASASSAQKETWIYDVAEDRWTPIDGELNLPGYRWLTATTSKQHGVVFLVAFGRERRTYALRYDPTAEPAKLTGAKPATIAWKYPEQKSSLEDAPPPDPEAHAKRLESLPPNTFVNANPPGMLISKTWSTAVIDSDRSEVIYHGGGHSGYSGNDFARYSIAGNRWTLDAPPRFPPYLEGTNAGIFAWSCGMIPFSQHTYLWYCYDPQSKTVLYLARPSLRDGIDLQLTDDPQSRFIYDSQKHGYMSWVYDSAAKRMHRPSLGRPFKNEWHLCVVGTPQGVYARVRDHTYHAAVIRETGDVEWRLLNSEFPQPRESIKYHYEFQPVVHDTQRNRLIQLKGDENRVDVFARPLDERGEWRQLETEGNAAIGREAVYIPRHDVVLWLGDQFHVFDCETNRMRRLDVELPEGRYGHECAMVYDPRHDVCVALIPSRFSGPMQTFLFRYQP